MPNSHMMIAETPRRRDAHVLWRRATGNAMLLWDMTSFSAPLSVFHTQRLKRALGGYGERRLDFGVPSLAQLDDGRA